MPFVKCIYTTIGSARGNFVNLILINAEEKELIYAIQPVAVDIPVG
jgi:hypothetical protein